MNLVHVAFLVHTVQSLDVDVQLISFDLKLETKKRVPKAKVLTMMRTGVQFRGTENTNITSKGVLCPTESLDKTQVENVLSDMLNQLTLVFAKVNHLIYTEVAKASRKFLDTGLMRRALQNRFKVAHHKRNIVFDQLFNNMTQNYRNLYNSSSMRIFRADKSDCKSEAQQKLWSLLEQSLFNLSKAINHCMKEYLKEQTIAPQSALGIQIKDLLTKEISQIRSTELSKLCEKFHMCNSTVLQQFVVANLTNTTVRPYTSTSTTRLKLTNSTLHKMYGRLD